MTTKEAIKEAASFFIETGRNPSETDIRLTLNDLVTNHDYAQAWAVKQVKAQLRKVEELKSAGLLRIVHDAIKRDQS